ncbi:TPA: hypothetical protein ACXE9L_002751 [Citrobacter koseri]|nr:hypothetical protein [Escherichia coli]
MQELYEGFCHNLLPVAWLDNSDDIGANRTRHFGEMMLEHFAKKAIRFRPHTI